MKNIVVIIIDALRTKNMSLYGYSKETDKNLKEIAKESILFTQHFSASNCTIPSLTALFTAKYPVNNGIIHQKFFTEEIEKLKKNTFWLPSLLKNSGYNTMSIDWISLWFRKDFDNFNERERTKYTKLKEVPIIHEIKALVPNFVYRVGRRLIKKYNDRFYYSAKETVDLAISSIKESKKPFFLFMRFFDTHEPFSTIEYTSKGKNETKKILNDIEDNLQRAYVKKKILSMNLFNFKDMNDKYDESIKYVDREIGRLTDFLKKNKLWDDTIFIVHSDHGWRLDERKIYLEAYGAYDEMYHTPLIMKIPGIKNKEINGLVQNVDIAPTILDLLGKKIDSKIDGKSLLPLIKNGKNVRDRAFLFDATAKNIKAVRTKKRKLIVGEDVSCLACKSKHQEKIEEYDLEKDLGETKNIYSGKSRLMKFLK